MITKVEVINLIKEFLIIKEELKKFSSKLLIEQVSKNYFIGRIDNQVYEIVLDKDEFDNIVLYYKGQIFVFKTSIVLTNKNMKNKKDLNTDVLIKSPMPGLISKILVNVGDKINKGQSLLKIEAMKMENEIKSSVNGIVESIKVDAGVVVEKNAVLMIIKSEK